MFSRYKWDQQGVVLPLVVMMIAVFTILSFSALFVVTSQNILGRRTAYQTKALHYAEAGVDAYLAYLNQEPDEPWNEWAPISFGDGFYQLKEVSCLTDPDDPSEIIEIVIESTGWLEVNDKEIKRTISARIEPSGIGWEITEWVLDPTG